ncbi:MAG TPA: hypothetical protein ENN69_08675, partial [Spirochaetia bacterium]|nr:hypothetical protein [Spirochaetia bacterium]
MKISFLKNRLLSMSPVELFWRGLCFFQNLAERAWYAFHTPRLGTRPVPETGWLGPMKIILTTSPGFLPTGSDRTRLLEEADALVQGRFEFFSRVFRIDPESIDYHRDPLTGRSAPRRRFGKTIDHRDREHIGDVKFIWELNRHLWLVTLARAYAASKERRYLDVFRAFLAAWFSQNPFMKGINWASSLE